LARRGGSPVPPARDFETGQFLAQLGGAPLASSWGSIEVELVRKNLGKRLAWTDFPWFMSNVPAYSATAVERLRPVLDAEGEILPLECRGGDFFALNVLASLDALDLERSVVQRFSSSGRLMDVERHVLRPDVIGDHAVFLLSAFDRGGWTYVTQAYVDEVRATGLSGVGFELVWSEA
jgi:hypothetical protein